MVSEFVAHVVMNGGAAHVRHAQKLPSTPKPYECKAYVIYHICEYVLTSAGKVALVRRYPAFSFVDLADKSIAS